MHKGTLLAIGFVLFSLPLIAADEVVDLDLAIPVRTVTIAVKPDTDLSVRLIYALAKKEYLRPDGSKFIRTGDAAGTGDEAECGQKALAKAINAGTTEADIAKRVDDALKNCTAEQKKAGLKFAADQTDIALGTFKVDFGKSVTIKIEDPGSPWTFTLVGEKMTLVTFDLSTTGGTQAVRPGDVKFVLTNAIVGKTYRRSPEGPTKTQPDPVIADDPPGCAAAVVAKLKALTEEKNADIKVPVDPCVPDKLAELVKKQGAAWQTVDFGDDGKDTVASGETRVFKIDRIDANKKVEKSWTFKLTAANQAGLTASEHPKLDEQRALTEKSPTLTTLRCSFKDEFCVGDAIYVNADQISTVYISDIEPGGFTTVRITAGESFAQLGSDGCSELNFNYREFSDAPDRLVFPLTMKSGFAGIVSVRWSTLIQEAERQYGFRCGSGGFRGLPLSSDPVIPLVMRGKSTLLTIQIVQNTKIKTFSIPIRYQRFWLDAGGFFAFARVNDQLLQREPVDNEPTKTKILSRKNNASVRPATGIVVNVHPGNRPIWAFQFGIAAAENRLPSYYLGVALRARELGRRALATIGLGVALQQEDLFPYVKAGDVRRIDDPALTATRRYAFQPYVSFAFGFSFGGVSEKADVAASVTSTK